MAPENQNNPSGWTYNAGGNPSEPAQDLNLAPAPASDPISWTGSEFLDRHKDLGWYIVLAIALVVVCGVIFLISKDLLSVLFVAVMGVLFGIVASRKPKELQYSINTGGLQIGKRKYTFGDFKSFSLQRDGAIGYINLMPLRRIAPELSIYYPPEQEQKIFDALSEHIPHEQVNESIIDRLFKTFHF